MQVSNEIIEKLSQVELFSDFNINNSDDFEILSEMVMDIIKATKKGKIYGKLK